MNDLCSQLPCQCGLLYNTLIEEIGSVMDWTEIGALVQPGTQ